jgi:multidrug resistance efflux pump
MEEKHMSTATKVAKHVVLDKAILDKLDSQVKNVDAKLETLKLKAEAAKAIIEIKAITALQPKFHIIRQKLQELKVSGGDRWEEAKADVETRIAEFEKALNALESKVKT